jgi:hypothetical protein
LHISYRYPALVTAKSRSAGGSWRRIVPMLGRAEISELSADEVPVAAIVSIIDRDGGVPLRFHEGRFYRKSHTLGFDEKESGLERTMGRAICEHLLSDRAQNSSLAPSVPSANGSEVFWSMWEQGRESLRSCRYQRGIPAKMWAACKPFDPVRHDGEMLEHWADVASDYVSSIISIDGCLWTPVDEPMMRWQAGSNPDEWIYDDTSSYRNAYGRRTDLPAPYGSADCLSDTIDHLHPYWNSRWKFLPLPEVVAAADDATGWLGDVLMPEAFTTDHAGLLLDRAARVSAFTIARATHYLIGRMAPGDWSGQQKSLKRVTRGRPGECPFEDIERTLEAFSDLLTQQQNALGRYNRSENLSGMIDEARERWNNRPIELGNNLGESLVTDTDRLRALEN